MDVFHGIFDKFRGELSILVLLLLKQRGYICLFLVLMAWSVHMSCMNVDYIYSYG